MASSPVVAPDRTSPVGRGRTLDSGLSVRVENICIGRPSHSAPYTIVAPSGEKRADITDPRLNVSCRYAGGGFDPTRSPITNAATRETATATNTAPVRSMLARGRGVARKAGRALDIVPPASVLS